MLQKSALIFLLLLGACSTSNEKGLRSFQGIAMTIPYEIKVETTVPAEKIQNTILQTFEEVNSHYNKFNPQSELSLINRLKAHQLFHITTGMKELLRETERFVALTDGYFDPTVETVAFLWKQAISQGSLPQEEALESLRHAVGWGTLHIDGDTISKDYDETALDLGGIAKGFTVDLLYQRLKESGAKHLYVEWGGEIRVSKEHPEGRPWKVAVDTPDLPDTLVTLELSDASVATSGDYAQSYALVDEKGYTRHYFHLIDPKTLRLLENRQGSPLHISVRASSCTEADAIATYLLLLKAKAN